MFSVRLVKADHYMNTPIPGLDARYSEFRGFEVKQVPVIRIFGSTSSGQKVCLHIHGVFPYIYIPYDGSIEKEKNMYQIASAIDKAINISQGNSNSHTQHIYKITHVSAKPLYGYHSNAHQFLKIYFYNPSMVKKTSDLLQNGAILGQVFQPHEAHIPFILQFCMDYNVHGMSFVKLACVRFRQGVLEGSFVKPTPLDNIPEELLLPDHILRTSTCSLEVDAVAADILNQQEISGQLTGNPGLKAIWDEEKERRRNENRNSQFTPQNSQTRHFSSTASERFHLDRLKKRLCEVALLKENSKPVMEKSPSGEKPKLYPAPTRDGESSLEASFLLSHVNSLCNKELSEETAEKCVNNECVDMNKNAVLTKEDTEPESSQSTVLNSQCLSLVQILQDLIEDDSVLGSQHQQDNEDEIEGASDNEDVLSQTLDNEKLECEALPTSSLRVSYNEGTEEISGLSGEKIYFSLPQLDGANDSLKEEEEIEKDSLQLKLLDHPQEQQEQRFNLVVESDTYCLTGVVLDVALPSDLPLINDPEDLCETRLNILECDEEVEVVPTVSLELSESSDNFDASEPTGLCLINPNQQDEKKPMFLPESVGTEYTVDNDKDVLSESLLLGDPWLTSQRTGSEKDEYLNESFSSTLKDPWPIDTENSSWIQTNENYFSDKSLITLSEVDETSSHLETGTYSELSVEKNNQPNCISTSETKRRLSSLIKSRTKAKEEQNSNKINSELISVDDINCEPINGNDFEISTPFGAIFQGSDYDQFFDESCCMGVQTIVNDIDSSLNNDDGPVGEMKTLGAGAILECNKNEVCNFLDVKQLLEGLGEGAFDVSNKIPKSKKLSGLSRKKFIKDGPISKQWSSEKEDNTGLKEYLPNGMLNCLEPGMKRRGRKPKILKEMEKNITRDTEADKIEKVENHYQLRNRVKYPYVKAKKKSNQLNAELKTNQYDTVCATEVVELTSDMQDSKNINNRIVKERLGILVRNSIDKKYPVREWSLEEKCCSHNAFFEDPNTRQCFDTSLSVQNSSHCEQSKFADENNTVALRTEVKLPGNDGVGKKSYLHRDKEQILNESNCDDKVSESKDNSLKLEEHQTNSSFDINLDNKTKTEDAELTKKRMGQYVRHKLGILVESRSKLMAKNIDKTVLLPSEVPSCKSPKNCNKICKRQRRNKRKEVKSVSADTAVNPENNCVNNNTGPNACDIAFVEKKELILDDKISANNTFVIKEKTKNDVVKKDLQIDSLIFENQVVTLVDIKVPEPKYSQSVQGLLNLYSIKSCCVKLQKLNREKLKNAKLLKSENVRNSYESGDLSLVKLHKSNFSCSNENLEHKSSEDNNHENKFLDTKETETTDSHRLHKSVLLSNVITEFVNPIYENSNRLENEELKYVVPNSPKYLDKGMENPVGEINSLNAVMQAESPRVADTLEILPANPSQAICHYALAGGVFLNTTDRKSVHLVGDYLKEGNIVEVAKIPSIEMHSASNKGCSLSKNVNPNRELQSNPATYMKRNKNISCYESSDTIDNSGMEFLTFTRVSPRKRYLRNIGKYKRKREKLNGNSPSTVSPMLLSDVSVPVLSNQVASFEDSCNKFEGENSADTNDIDITVKDCISKEDKQASCYHKVNVESNCHNEKIKENGSANLSPNCLLPNNVLKENAPSLSSGNSPTSIEFPSKCSLNLQSELKPEVSMTENKQLLGQEKFTSRATELQNSSKNLNEKTFSLSESTSKTFIRKSKRIKLKCMKLRKRNSTNELLSLNKNCMVVNSKRELSLSKPEECVSINAQLKPASRLDESVHEKSRSITIVKDAKISENNAECYQLHSKPAKMLHKLHDVTETDMTSHRVLNLDSNGEGERKELNTIVVENVVSKIRKQRSIPCVDGANDSNSSDASNDFVPLAVMGRTLRKRSFKSVMKQAESGNVSEEGSSFSQRCDVNITPEKEREIESLGKGSPVKYPKKQTYKPLDVVIKKSPEKNNRKQRRQVDIPSENYVSTSFKNIVKQAESGDVSEEGSSFSQMCDANITPEKEMEVESVGKGSPIKYPKKETCKPLDVVIKKSPEKNNTKQKRQVDIPSENYISTKNTKHQMHEDLIKYLSLVLRKRITKQDVRKFNPRVIVTRLNSCISNSQSVNLRTSRLRQLKLSDEICICTGHWRNKSIADLKCDKPKGLSLDLHCEQLKERTCGFEHQGEHLHEVSCQ